MLSENPDLYDMFAFRGIKNKEQSKQLESELLQLHAEAVMNVFDQAIQSIEDADAFFAVLERYGRTHANKKNFTPDLFWVRHLLQFLFRAAALCWLKNLARMISIL